MKKFIYSMENLLHVKVKLEDQAKLSYQNAKLRLIKEEEKLNQLEVKKALYEEELRKLQMQKLNILSIKKCQDAIEVMKLMIKQQAIMVKNANQRLELERKRLNEAMVERKVQDKLKEKAYETYMLECEIEERKEVDEIVNYKISSVALNEEDR